MFLSDATLNHSARTKSFEDLRSVNYIQYASYKESLRALGMLQYEQLWHLVMEDLRQQNLPMQIRELFVILMTFTDLMNPTVLFQTFSEAMSEGFKDLLINLQTLDRQLPKWMLLIDIQQHSWSAEKGKLFQRADIVTDENWEDANEQTTTTTTSETESEANVDAQNDDTPEGDPYQEYHQQLDYPPLRYFGVLFFNCLLNNSKIWRFSKKLGIRHRDFLFSFCILPRAIIILSVIFSVILKPHFYYY